MLGWGWAVTIAGMSQLPVIQGVVCGRVCEAWNLTETVDALKACASQGRAIVDYGRFHRDLGAPPPNDFAVVRGPSGVVEHARADMTVRVRAGTTLGNLRRDLAEANQWLPIDGPSEMSIGEAVAHHVSGPWRCGVGSVRDLLLGLRYLSAEGEEIVVGGRTIKNVAGYDVTRLMVGSWNTLGMLTEATLRTSALPECLLRVTLEGVPLDAFEQQLTALMVGDGAPGGLWHAMSEQGIGRAKVLYAGREATCEAQVARLEKWLRGTGFEADLERDRIEPGAGVDTAWGLAWDTTVKGSLKLIVPSAGLGRVLEQVSLPDGTRIEALPSHGLAWLGGDWDAAQAVGLHAELLRVLGPEGGRVVWHRRPEQTVQLPIYAPMARDWSMQDRIKTALDPNGLFNPGRMGGRDGSVTVESR